MDLDKRVSKYWKPGDNRRACCRQKDNMQYEFELNTEKDRVVLKCRKCGAIHHYQQNDPGVIFAKPGM